MGATHFRKRCHGSDRMIFIEIRKQKKDSMFDSILIYYFVYTMYILHIFISYLYNELTASRASYSSITLYYHHIIYLLVDNTKILFCIYTCQQELEECRMFRLYLDIIVRVEKYFFEYGQYNFFNFYLMDFKCSFFYQIFGARQDRKI